MRCYDCALEGANGEVIGFCVSCGKAVCMEHSKLDSVARYYEASGGMSSALARCAFDLARLSCLQCHRALHCCPPLGSELRR